MPEQEYRRRIDAWTARVDRADRLHLLVSNLRLATAGAGALLFWFIFVRHAVAAWWITAPVVAFGALAVRHARVLQAGERGRRARAWYERGLERMAGRWMGRGRDGARYLGPHLYARDLDLFGPGSLFELLNHARSEIGEDTLASWLLAPAEPQEVRARQAAVAELRPMLDLREDIVVLAAEAGVSRTGALAAWTASAPQDLPAALRILFPACAAATVALAAAAYLEILASGWLLAWIVLEASMAAIWRVPIGRVLHGIETPEHDLALLAELLARVEREVFESPKLAALREALMTGSVPPSRRIAQLRQMVSWLDATHNLLFGPFAYVLLARPQLALAINAWHREYGAAVGGWLEVIGELEALSCLASHAHEHPDDAWPAVSDGPPVFAARALGHPLIADRAVVRNDVAIGGAAPHVLVVSGSNMSGKSTLLRAVGVNAVLALAGGTVRADSLELSPLAIGATLRIEDSLQEGHSRFYTEILRIKAIVDLTGQRRPVLFLLDEILHGTNSHDRRIGAEAIVTALIDRGAIGLVTTHDLSLAGLTSTLGSAAANVHFEDRIEQGTMVFDYRMRPGVVERSNAIELMRAVGLEI